tara:strand:- start:916 stop:1062 length:147 start_codon:yes stop_codon:yes gene_type:complete
MKINKTFIVWGFFVVLWNFGVPQAAPVFDVLFAVIFFFLSKFLEKHLQ